MTETVETNTLDHFVEHYQLKPGFIKIDAEGAEGLIFEKGMKTITKHLPVIFAEISDRLLVKAVIPQTKSSLN